MDLHAAFDKTLERHLDASPSSTGTLAPANGAASDMYASLMSKENNVLELVRRVDDTKRADALKQADRIAPLANAFVAGIASFLARLMHYASSGATKEAIGLMLSPDGMVYTGTMIAIFGVLLLSL